MKKQLATALNAFKTENMCVDKGSKKREVKAEIRAIADNEESFNDVIFELGCEVLAKEYLKQSGA